MLGQPVSMLVPAGRRLPAHRASCPRARPRPTWCCASPRCCARRAWSASSSSSSGRAWRSCRWPTARRSPTWRPSTAPPAASSRSTRRRSTTCASPGASEEQVELVEAYCSAPGPVPRRATRPSADYTDTLELDLGDRRAEPGRPQAPAGPGRARRDVKRASPSCCESLGPTADAGAAPSGDGRRDARRQVERVGSRAATVDARRGRDRRHHELHQHLEPVGHGRRRAWSRRRPSSAASTAKPWVKTSLAPGSKVVTEYLDAGGAARPTSSSSASTSSATAARPASATAGRCPMPVGEAIDEHGLVAASVLSGNRNFEGRIHAAGARQLPGLAAAGGGLRAGRTGRHRPQQRAAGARLATAAGLPARHLADPAGGRRHGRERGRARRCSRRATPTSSRATRPGARCECPRATPTRGTRSSTYVKEPPYFDGMHARAAGRSTTSRARASWRCSATASPPTTSRRPAAIKADSPAGRYLAERGVEPRRTSTPTARGAATTRSWCAAPSPTSACATSSCPASRAA